MKRTAPGSTSNIKEIKVKLADVDKVINRVNDLIQDRPFVQGLVKKGVDLDEEVYISEGSYYLKVCGRWLVPGKAAARPHCLVLPIADREVKSEYTPISAAKLIKKYTKDWDHLVDNLNQIYYVSSKAALQSYGEPGKTYKHCWSYDINKCYLWVLKTYKMPDTRHIYLDEIPKEGQIGFVQIGTTYNAAWDEWRDWIELVVGSDDNTMPCDYVFDLMDSPFQDFADLMVSKMEEANEKLKSENPKTVEKGLALKKKYKYLTNVAVGLLQNTNPFMRAAVVGYANKYIRSLVADDPSVLLYNTDSIISTRPRPDLPIGDGVGQWKLEHEDEAITFAGKVGLDYQWASGESAHRGVAENDKKIYTFNKSTHQIERIKGD